MAQAQPQTAFDEKPIENPDLEELLEKRQDALEGRAIYNQRHRAAKAVIDAQDWDVGVYRVGRFRIKVAIAEGGKEISFTRTSSKGFRIKLAEGDDDAAD